MSNQLDPPIARRFLDLSQAALPDLVREVVAITEIPAPTGDEWRRSAYVQRRMQDLGLSDVSTDEIGNVTGRISGSGGGPTLLLAAHIDTVFPIDTPLHVQLDGEVLRGPSVGDNSASVAVMLLMLRTLLETGTRIPGDLILVATVGEEGLGNLRGIRAAMDRFAHEVDYVIAMDGSMGGMVRQGVGSRRFRLMVTSDGGHSWGAFGVPSAIHSLGRMISQISDLRVPSNPKTTFNVGTIKGGTSVNTIAASAEAVLDLRSLDSGELHRLEDRVRRIVAETARQTGVGAELELLGERPVGSISDEHPLCQTVRQVHQQLGIQTRSYASSTDANVPLSMGIPAVTVGVTLGGNGHRLDEYIYASPLVKGMGQMLLLVLAAQRLPAGVR